MNARHRTPGEKRAAASAQAAIARALAHVRPPPTEDDDQLGRLYPYVTPTRAKQIRHELEEQRSHGAQHHPHRPQDTPL